MEDKCPRCNHDLISFTEGSTLVVTCPNCGYTVATSNIEPIYEDENIYRISIESGNTLKKEFLKAISDVSGVNYLKAKTLIENAPIEIYRGSALDVLDKKRILDRAGIKYSISPDFPY